MSKTPEARQIYRRTAAYHARALNIIKPRLQESDDGRDLFRVHAAIGIERYDNIPRTVNESFAQRVTFCRAPIARQPGQLAGRGGPPRSCLLGRGRLPRLPHAAMGAACAARRAGSFLVLRRYNDAYSLLRGRSNFRR